MGTRTVPDAFVTLLVALVGRLVRRGKRTDQGRMETPIEGEKRADRKVAALLVSAGVDLAREDSPLAER